ncbi:uncharacterized protein LOC127810475 [Diospyros lotus]|uniref:uncharacterized protein LOC127810475 n=1 Tax=Diospyros lotus TaxID=55363 RepID=UPI0022535868|nr:uncharacterized protein LOC127810475 [Diospyros lotus]
MGSLEEAKIFEMDPYDFIDESESQHPSTLSSKSNSIILQEILESNTKAEAEVLETVMKHIPHRMKSSRSVKKKWLVMRLRKDGYCASLRQTSWPTAWACPDGGYQYIDVAVEEHSNNNNNNGAWAAASCRVIVDVDFRSQFEVARPAAAYKELTAALPAVFVGGEEKLSRVITLVCAAAEQSLREGGLHVPPWRTPAYMHSKYSKVRADLKTNDNGPKLFSKYWAPPPLVREAKSRGFGGGSGLSTQFSNVTTKCC